MKDYSFTAPTLYDASITVAPEDEVYEEPAAKLSRARMKPFVLWLKSELIKKGIDAGDPDGCEGEWIFVIDRNDDGEVNIVINEHGTDEGLFLLIVMELGDGSKDVAVAVEDILRNSGEIVDLKIG